MLFPCRQYGSEFVFSAAACEAHVGALLLHLMRRLKPMFLRLLR